jgi:hypothetical protein
MRPDRDSAVPLPVSGIAGVNRGTAADDGPALADDDMPLADDDLGVADDADDHLRYSSNGAIRLCCETAGELDGDHTLADT